MAEVAQRRMTARAYLSSEMPQPPGDEQVKSPSSLEGSTYQVISRPHELHCTLLRINPTSLRSCIPILRSQNKNARKSLFASPGYPTESRPKDVART